MTLQEVKLVLTKPELSESDERSLQDFLAEPFIAERPATTDELLFLLRQISVATAKRDDVLVDGKLKVAVYIEQLSSYPLAALEFMKREIIKHSKWMPLPSECLEVLERYRPEQAGLRLSVESKLTSAKQAKLSNAMRRLKLGEMSADEFASLPKRWQQIAETQGHARFDNGEYVLRP